MEGRGPVLKSLPRRAMWVQGLGGGGQEVLPLPVLSLQLQLAILTLTSLLPHAGSRRKPHCVAFRKHAVDRKGSLGPNLGLPLLCCVFLGGSEPFLLEKSQGSIVNFASLRAGRGAAGPRGLQVSLPGLDKRGLVIGG